MAKKTTRPRITPPREQATEEEFRRSVFESLREIARVFEMGVGLGELRGQRIELTVEGDDTDIEVRLDKRKIRSKPSGVWVLEVLHIASNTPGSMGGTVPWQYTVTRDAPYIRILNLPGLAAGEKYKIALFVIGGEA